MKLERVGCSEGRNRSARGREQSLDSINYGREAWNVDC